jgi:hypothetical protein
MVSNVGGEPANFLRSSVLTRNWSTMRRTFALPFFHESDCPSPEIYQSTKAGDARPDASVAAAAAGHRAVVYYRPHDNPPTHHTHYMVMVSEVPSARATKPVHLAAVRKNSARRSRNVPSRPMT